MRGEHQNKAFFLYLYRISAFGPIGVCAYIASFAVPLEFGWDIPLTALALIGILATVISFKKNSVANSSLTLPVLVFLGVMGLSILVSEDFGRSMRLSAPLAPAALLFFLIAEHFNSIQDTRLLYFTFSLVELGLACMLLWAAWRTGGMDPDAWVSNVRSPILLVKNDVTFLAVVAPLSLVLAYRNPRSVVGILALLSILLSVCVVGVFQSRIAMLTMVTSITFGAALVRPRLGLICGLAIPILILLIDASLGFPLVARFGRHWEGSGRIPLWLAAWAMFLHAPLLGHGAHTFVLFYGSYLQRLNLPPWLFTDPRVVPWAHNLYLEVLAEQGIIGLMALGFVLARGVSSACSIQRVASSETRIFGAGAVAGLASFCLAGMFELTLLRQWVVIIMFTLLGVIAQLSSFDQVKQSVEPQTQNR